MINRSDVTIIVPTLYKTDEQMFALKHCLMSLRETEPDIHVIVAKNGGTEPLEGFLSGFSAIYLREQGQCRAVNEAVKTTHTPWIMVTNDDMVYPHGWFDKMAEWNTSTCLSPRLVEPRQGAPTFVVEFCGGAGGDFDKEKWLKFAGEYMKGQYTQEKGFNLPFLIRRDLWDLLGGYDEAYDPWGSNSDSDLEYKIKLAGVQPMQVRNCVVYHFSNTSGTFEPRNQEHWNANWQYFIDKWGFPRTDDGIWEATFEIPKPPVRKFCPDWEGKYVV